MRALLLVVGLVSILSAQTVEIVADKFFADEIKQVTEFTGNVVITKGKDKLVAKKVVINFDKQRQPLKYVATGDVAIDMVVDDKVYFAKAQTAVYDPIKSEYTLIKDAFLHERVTNKKIYGDKIFVNQVRVAMR